MTSRAAKLIPTTVIGSYPQPDWLVDKARLHEHFVPRVRASDVWRVSEPLLKDAQDDATLLAIRDMERTGIDAITDGEIRRESYSNHFVVALGGLDVDNPYKIEAMPGHTVDVPRIVGPLSLPEPVQARDVAFLVANTDRVPKITLPGPFTLSLQAKDEYYGDGEALAMAFAEVVNTEARALVAAGAEVIQIDEPWLRRDPAAAARYAVKAINRAFEGVTATAAVHLCFGYGFIDPAMKKPRHYPFLEQLADSVVDQISIEAAQPDLDLDQLAALSSKSIIFGALNLSTTEIETAEEVADRLRRALDVIAPERLIAGPDCGMKYLPRAVAFGKLKALADGAAIVRAELAGSAG